MFGRGQWAVFGIKADSLSNFQKALSDSFTVFEVSQLAASVTTRFQNQQMTGVNPFGAPRLDEQLTDPQIITEISEVLVKLDAGESVVALPDCLNYVGAEVDFSLGNSKYGFWIVNNEYKDPSDPNSKKEQIAYMDCERPFKFLTKEEKQAIEDRVTAQAVLNRSQFPVLVDFQNERVFAETSDKDEVTAVQEFLTKLGAVVFPLVWDFDTPTWPEEFLNAVVKETHFSTQMKERADELSRFRPDEVAKLEDKQMEKIVSTFFALSELESEVWVGLSTPARIRIHKPIDPVGVSNPSVAFSLLNLSSDAETAAASVVFQELVTRNTKDGEKTLRKNLFTVDINDNMNLQEAGAAMLRGFDLPQFKREIKTTIKAKGRIEIRDFWFLWLQGLNDSVLEFVDNVTDVLGIDKKKYGLMVFESSADSELVEVSE